MDERLQKVLAGAGIASRRASEQIILDGRVTVNGKVVKELGTKVSSKDKITVDGKPVVREKKVYYILNKPRGVVTTMSDPQGRTTVADFLKHIPQRVVPVGRLDYGTEGLLLVTNDGDLTLKLTHPSHEVGKLYRAVVQGLVSDEKLDILRLGVRLEDGLTAPAIVNLLARNEDTNTTEFTIEIHEGRNRQIRRMCDFIGYPIKHLKRLQIGNLTIAGLKVGQYRALTEAEVADLRKVAEVHE